jgi:hypothetical protein
MNNTDGKAEAQINAEVHHANLPEIKWYYDKKRGRANQSG